MFKKFYKLNLGLICNSYYCDCGLGLNEIWAPIYRYLGFWNMYESRLRDIVCVSVCNLHGSFPIKHNLFDDFSFDSLISYLFLVESGSTCGITTWKGPQFVEFGRLNSTA